VRTADPGESGRIGAMVARAFAGDPIERWCLACDQTDQVQELEFTEVARYLSPRGWLWVIDDLSGAAAWFPPGGTYGDAIDPVVNPVLTSFGGRPDRLVEFWGWVDERRPAGAHWYADLIAVDPRYQGSGRGRVLLEHGLRRIDRLGQQAFLITGNGGTVPWYERHGFAVASEDAAPGGDPTVWFLIRPPRPGPPPAGPGDVQVT